MSDKTELAVATWVGALMFPAIFALRAATILLETWVYTKLWAWHVAPHFQVAPLPFGTAFAIGALVTMLTIHAAANAPDSPGDKWRRILAHQILMPLFLLAIGALLR